MWLWGQNLSIHSLLHMWPQHTRCIAPGHLSPPLQLHRADFTLSPLDQTMLSQAPGPRVPDIKNLELRLNSPEGDLSMARQGRTSSRGKTHMLEGFFSQSSYPVGLCTALLRKPSTQRSSANVSFFLSLFFLVTLYNFLYFFHSKLYGTTYKR